jgi:hypothetical protein
MKRRFLSYLTLSSCSLGVSVLAFSSVTYVAKKGDKLSKIAGKNIPGPVWGKNGSFKPVLALNKGIKNPDMILPGQIIELPDGALAQATEAALADRVPATIVPEPSPVLNVTSAPVAPPAPVASSLPVASQPVTWVAVPVAKEGVSTSVLEVAPYYAITSLPSTDRYTNSPANLASSLNAGVDVRYHQNWSDTFGTYFHLRLGELSFKQPQSVSETLQSGSNFMSGVGFGANFKLSQSLTFSLFGDYEQEAFVQGLSTNSVAVNTVAIPEAGGSLDLDLFKRDGLTLGVSGQYSVLFPASAQEYNVLEGSLYGGKVYVKQEGEGASSLSYQTELGYFQRQENTTITNQTEKDVVLQFRWFLPFGRKSTETK